MEGRRRRCDVHDEALTVGAVTGGTADEVEEAGGAEMEDGFAVVEGGGGVGRVAMIVAPLVHHQN